MFNITKKKVAALAVAGGVALSTGVAYSYWTTTGSGTGSGGTTGGVVDVLTFGQDTLSAMYPGDAAQPFDVSVTNTDPNESAYVSTIKAYVTVTKAEGAVGDCDADDFRLHDGVAPGTAETAVAITWTAQDLDAGESADASSSIQFNNKPTTNQDGCKNAAVTVHYLAS